jgi:peptidoglycan/xylan/chitin deacetylase (PgdA/CDA1 family)
VIDLIVLCYHAVAQEWEADLAVSPAQFEAQVRFLVERGYRGATFHDAVTAPRSRRTVAITFDDGFCSVAERAFPILASYELPATIFVVTDFVGGTSPLAWSGIDHWRSGRFRSELAPVSWAQLRQLVDAGWEVGSHTCTHPRLTQCGEDQLVRELRDSKESCEQELGITCRSLAYPYGDVDFRVERAASEVGYATAGGLPGRWRGASLLTWPRVGVWHGETLGRFRLKASPAFRRAQTSTAWAAVEAGRRLLRSPELG